MRALLMIVVVSWLAGVSQPAPFDGAQGGPFDGAQGTPLITSAATVRLREAASTTAPVVRELPLGTRLESVGPAGAGGTTSDGWIRVRTTDAGEGWILASLARPIDPARPLVAIEAIVRDRLPSVATIATDQGPRVSGESFATRVQLVRLLEDAPLDGADVEVAARFALYRLRALQYALGAVPFGRGNTSPYVAWLDAHRSEVRYNEPGGRWLLEYEHVRVTYEPLRGSRVGDEIAWMMVTNGLAGECEGDLPCAASWINRLEGEYLRMRPTGGHVETAHASITERLNGYLTNVESFPKVLAEFVPASHCGDLKSSLDPLRAAVIASQSAKQAGTLAAIARWARLCE